MKQTYRTRQLRDYLADVLAEGAVERIHDEADYVERIAPEIDKLALSEQEAHCARQAMHKLCGDEELTVADRLAVEAIILPQTRPVVDIASDTFDAPKGYWGLLGRDGIRNLIEAAIPSVGRIELPDDPRLAYGGTGFIVGPDLLMTNRHVAELFCSGLGAKGINFKPGQSSIIDFREEYVDTPNIQIRVVSVVMIHPYWDMALLRVDGLPSAQIPLTLGTTHPEDLNQRNVAIIGYPAFDPRNSADVQNRIFRGIYDVKRLQPGTLTGRKLVQSFENSNRVLEHNASTLGGNSGSAVIDLASGEVVGLHFAGRYMESNYAVPSYELARDPFVREAGVRFDHRVSAGPIEWMNRWRTVDPQPEVGASSATLIPVAPPSDDAITAGQPTSQPTTQVSLLGMQGGEAVFTIPLRIAVSLGRGATSASATVSAGAAGDGASIAGGTGIVDEASKPRTIPDPDYSNREGYDANFLAEHYLRLPWLSAAQYGDTARNVQATRRRRVLPYNHFSVVMNRKRRMAFYSAVNVDGKRLREVTRSDFRDHWVVDPRIKASDQLENEFYKDVGDDGNPLDRGHLVRRLDPCWGSSKKEVLAAHHDTFHWTNCSPQHASFNRGRSIWLGIENYILKKSAKKDLRVSVFSGPVLDDENDPTYTTPTNLEIQLPTQYWKVVAVVQANGVLAATGYLLSQDELIDSIIEVPVFADFNHYQVTVAEIENLTGLYFWGLADHDPLAADGSEAIAGTQPRRVDLSRYEDVILGDEEAMVIPTKRRSVSDTKERTPQKANAKKNSRGKHRGTKGRK